MLQGGWLDLGPDFVYRAGVIDKPLHSTLTRWIQDMFCRPLLSLAAILCLSLRLPCAAAVGLLVTTICCDSVECTAGRTAVGDRTRHLSTPKCRRAWRLYDIATAGIGDSVHPAGIPGLPMYIDPLNALGPSGGADLPGSVQPACLLGATCMSAAFTAGCLTALLGASLHCWLPHCAAGCLTALLGASLRCWVPHCAAGCLTALLRQVHRVAAVRNQR